jgi:isopentenyl-diphosphate delta-isomerase
MIETLILVNRQDQPQGYEEKLTAHKLGLRHRAFSVFIFNPQGELLIQRRALCKYHSAGLWANTTCGHPRPGETNADAAKRRLWEELGIRCALMHVNEVCYTLKLENGLHENEYTHIFHGKFNGTFTPDPDEVMETKWVKITNLIEDIKLNPQMYARWFRLYALKYANTVFCERKNKKAMVSANGNSLPLTKTTSVFNPGS